MRYFYASLGVIFITGCASTSVVMNDSGTNSESIIITSKCDSDCQKLVNSSFQIKPMETLLFGSDKPVKQYVVLTRVNGQLGQGTHFDPYGAYNNSWDGSFSVKTNSGNVEITILPSSRSNAGSEELALSFNGVSGHKYLVGSMGWREIVGNVQVNNWHPLIVDLSTSDIVYPKSQPAWRKYCTLNQEWAGGTSCP